MDKAFNQLFFDSKEDNRNKIIDDLTEQQAKSLLKCSMSFLHATSSFFDAMRSDNVNSGIDSIRHIQGFATTAAKATFETEAQQFEPVRFICPSCGHTAIAIRRSLRHGYAYCPHCGMAVSV